MLFGGKIVFIGCGSVAQCALQMLHSFIEIPLSRILIISFEDNRHKIDDLLKMGVQYIFARLNPENYSQILKEHLSPGDLLIDLAWNIDTGDLIQWCHDHQVCFLNTSVEVWDPYTGAHEKHPTELTLYHRQMHLRKIMQPWKGSKAATAIVDHGANPGLVSHFTKRALSDIAHLILKKKPQDSRRTLLERALTDQDFAQLAFATGVKTIHISERDTQITDKPKRCGEFVNTWSVEGFIEEGVAPAELGWGTHEKLIPKGAFFHQSGPENQICLPQKGINTWVKSWVPSGPIIGMVIRHGEAFSISEALTIRDGDQVLYRPTVHYAYCPCDSALNSLHELEMSYFKPQRHQRILANEIIDGHDELGCLLMGHDFGAWWIGSMLDIEKARELVPGQNATTVQVAAGVLAAAVYILRHPQLGFCLPDQLDHEEILSLAMPYLGQFLSFQTNWRPDDHAEAYADYGVNSRSELADTWQFAAFALSPHEFVTAQECDSQNIETELAPRLNS